MPNHGLRGTPGCDKARSVAPGANRVTPRQTFAIAVECSANRGTINAYGLSVFREVPG